MCRSKECPIKDKCYRFTAKPSEYQYYFIESPFEINDDKFSCDMLWTKYNTITMDELKKIVMGEYNKPNKEVKQRQKRKK